MTQFVRLTEDDPTFDLVTLINRLNGAKPVEQKQGDDEEDAELTAAQESPLGKLVMTGRFMEFIDKGFFKNIDKISADDEALESAYHLLFALLAQLPEKDRQSVAQKLSFGLTLVTEKQTQTRLQLLTTLFNSFQTSALRHNLFQQILQYALDTNNQSLLDGQLGDVDEWVKAWGLSDKQAALVYGACFKVVVDDEALRQSFLVQHLKFADKSAFKNSKDLVAEAIVEAVRGTDLGRLDQLWRLPVVAAQKGQPAYALLDIYLTGKVAQFAAFAKANGPWFKANTLDANACAVAVRTLALCTLGAATPTLTYARLMTELTLPDHDAVEEAVIDAVTSGLLDAQIDQENGVVIIRRTTERQWRDSEWTTIAAKLDAWKVAVHRTLSVLADREE
jgi:translation initiation factor 3 subunit M